MVGCLASAAVPATAQLGVDAQVSTLGIGAELTVPLGSRAGLRIGARKGTVERDFSEDGVDYEADLELENASLLLDWHPTGGAFRLSAGGLLNRNELVARASADDRSLEIGNIVVDSSQVESLRGTVSFQDVSPYVGLGFSTGFGRSGGWGFVFDLGVVHQGSPEVDLEGRLVDELAPLDPLFQVQLAVEEDNLEREIEEYELYPVVTLGVSYTF